VLARLLKRWLELTLERITTLDNYTCNEEETHPFRGWDDVIILLLGRGFAWKRRGSARSAILRI
jgi:hypothetical protein